MEGCFMFQWGRGCFSDGGRASFLSGGSTPGRHWFWWGRFSKKVVKWGGGGRPPHLPPRTMGNPAILVYPKTKITDNIFNHQNGTKTHQIFPANIYFL